MAGNPSGADRKQLLSILGPAVGVAAIVIVVALVAGGTGGDEKDKGKGAGTGGAGAGTGGSVTEGAGQPMSDGSNGGTDDPGLKPIGTEGLKYRDLKEGTGEAVPAGATIKAHYTGWLPNGKVFDSSKKRGEPIEFSLNGVVQGWGQGIPGMKVGGVRKLVIPAALGYGARGMPPDIPGGATLIFEVEVVSLVK